jgi:hemoglobin-like flavoprotein
MFDAYHKWLAIPPDQRPPTYYQLLGIALTEADSEVIREAAIRQTSHLRTYQSGVHAEPCARLLTEVALACKTLLDPELRQQYDAQIRKPVAASDHVAVTRDDSFGGDAASGSIPVGLLVSAEHHRSGQRQRLMDIQRSLHRVLEQGEKLPDLFYFTVFLKTYPELKPYFEAVNFQHQGMLLSMALLVTVYHYLNPCYATKMYLRYLGKKHDARGIPAELYPKWRECLIETLEKMHGKEWNEQLAAHWRKAIDLASQQMLRSSGS